MKIRAWVESRDKSDPLDEFHQVAISVHREDGKSLTWRGARIPQARDACGFSLNEAIASAVEAMLVDTTVLEFVGMFKTGRAAP